MDLREALTKLAELRRDEEAARTAVDAAFEIVKSTPEYQAYEALAAKKAELSASRADAEQRVRDLTLAAFRATGDKAPMPGAAVKLFRQVRYDSERVRDWCWTQAPTLLVLDAHAFDEIGVVLIARGAPAEIAYDPRAQIGRDLSAYLTAAEEPAGED